MVQTAQRRVLVEVEESQAYDGDWVKKSEWRVVVVRGVCLSLSDFTTRTLDRGELFWSLETPLDLPIGQLSDTSGQFDGEIWRNYTSHSN